MGFVIESDADQREAMAWLAERGQKTARRRTLEFWSIFIFSLIAAATGVAALFR